MTFTSSSTVRFFLSGGGIVPDGARVVSIGPVTSATLREHGLEPARRGRAATTSTAWSRP